MRKQYAARQRLAKQNEQDRAVALIFEGQPHNDSKRRHHPGRKSLEIADQMADHKTKSNQPVTAIKLFYQLRIDIMPRPISQLYTIRNDFKFVIRKFQ